MPRMQCYWTRKLELELVEFIKQREFIWKPVGNTNHDIQKKYKAYAEFAASLDRGFTARSVRDRWVNIRSTFNYYLRRIEKSKLNKSTYVPCWPLWKPLQFLRDGTIREDSATFHNYTSTIQAPPSILIKTEQSDTEDTNVLFIRQPNRRTDRPRRKGQVKLGPREGNPNGKCKRILDDLIVAMKPLTEGSVSHETQNQPYWFFGKHVTERLNSMSEHNSECAGNEIMRILDEWPIQNN